MIPKKRKRIILSGGDRARGVEPEAKRDGEECTAFYVA